VEAGAGDGEVGRRKKVRKWGRERKNSSMEM
jgi:hypothetical protein